MVEAEGSYQLTSTFRLAEPTLSGEDTKGFRPGQAFCRGAQ